MKFPATKSPVVWPDVLMPSPLIRGDDVGLPDVGAADHRVRGVVEQYAISAVAERGLAVLGQADRVVLDLSACCIRRHADPRAQVPRNHVAEALPGGTDQCSPIPTRLRSRSGCFPARRCRRPSCRSSCR